MLTVRTGVQPFSKEQTEIELGSTCVAVPEAYAESVMPHWTDGVRFNKAKRKTWLPLLTIGFRGFNELVEFDLSKKDINDRLEAIRELRIKIGEDIQALRIKIEARTGKEQRSINKALDNPQKDSKINLPREGIVLDDLHGLIKNELAQWLILNAVYKKLGEAHAQLEQQMLEAKEQPGKAQSADGVVPKRDDVYQDPSVHHYTISDGYSHPSNRFQQISTENLCFAIQQIYSSEKDSNGEGLGLEGILDTAADLLEGQKHFWATRTTREFKKSLGQELEERRRQVRHEKQGLAESAYGRLVRDLVDETVLPIERFSILANFVKKHGNFTTSVIPRSELNHALRFAKTQLHNLKKPLFKALRKTASEVYEKKRIFIEGTIRSLTSRLADTRAIIDAAKENAEAHQLHQLLKEYNTSVKPGNIQADGAKQVLTLENLWETDYCGELVNLKALRAFMVTKIQGLAKDISNTKWYQKIFGTEKRKQFKEKQAYLSFLKAFEKASSKTIQGKESLENTEQVRLVVDDDLSKDFLKQYNTQRNKNNMLRLLTGVSAQLIESRILYRDKSELLDQRQRLSSHELFKGMIQAYNIFRAEKQCEGIAIEGGNKRALEVLNKNADFADFIKMFETKNEADCAQESIRQQAEYYSNVLIHLNQMNDRFLIMARLYNEYKKDTPDKQLDLTHVYALPEGLAEGNVIADNIARKRAYEKLHKQADFSGFIEWYKGILNKGDKKDTSDYTRDFLYYLECIGRDLVEPSRFLAVRLKERIQDAFERFSDLVIYGGINKANVQQAKRYIDLILFSLAQWRESGFQGNVPVRVKGVDLNDKITRDKFIQGLKLARKLITGKALGESIKLPEGKLQEVEKSCLNAILPQENLGDTAYGSVASLLISRYSSFHLRQQFASSELRQVELDAKKLGPSDITSASEGKLIKLISYETALDVERQYKLIASDAFSYFRQLFWASNSSNLVARTVPGLLLSIHENQEVEQIERMARYFKTTRELAPQKIAKLKESLAFKQQEPKKFVGKTCCKLDDVYLYWDTNTMKQLLVRIKMNSDLKERLRTEIIGPYLTQLEEQKELSLEVFEKYAIVFSTVFNEAEIKKVARKMLAIIFNPELKGKIELSEVIKSFLRLNKSILGYEINQAIENYITRTKAPYYTVTSDLIFEFGSAENQENYAIKRLKEILVQASGNAERMNSSSLTAARAYIDYLQTKKENFKFDQIKLGNLFSTYAFDKQDEANFWRDSIDRLACEYFTSPEGQKFIHDGRLAQIQYFLDINTKVHHQLSDISNFYAHTCQFGKTIKVSQEVLNGFFELYFSETFVQIQGPKQKLDYLNLAERVALHFDVAGEWLDRIRLIKIEFALNKELGLSVQEIIECIQSEPSIRPYPVSKAGESAFYVSMQSRFVNVQAQTIVNKYQYKKELNPLIKKLALAFDKKGLLLDQVRLAELTNAYTENDLQRAESVLRDIFTKPQPDSVLNDGRSIFNFPLTAIGKGDLELFFKQSIIIDEYAHRVSERYQYHAVTEVIALRLDSTNNYLTMTRLAKMAELMSQNDVNNAKVFAGTILSSDKALPESGAMYEELQKLLLEHVFPNGEKHSDVSERYFVNEAIEVLVHKFGSEAVKVKCKIAKIAMIIQRILDDTSLTDVYMQRAQQEGLLKFAKQLQGEEKTALIELLEFYSLRKMDWSPSFERILESFEPEVNNKKLLKSYRLKRLKEIFKEKGSAFTFEEYDNYQRLLGVDWVASKNNINRMFGLDANNEAIKSLFIDFIDDALRRKANGQFEAFVLKNTALFELAKLLITEALLGNAKIPGDHSHSSSVGKEYSRVWTELLRDFEATKQHKVQVEEVKALLGHGHYAAVKTKYKEATRHATNYSSPVKQRPEQDLSQEFVVLQAAIAESTIEFSKEQLGYSEQLQRLQIKIQKIVASILGANELSVLRQKVGELLGLMPEIPAVASAKLRGALLSIQELERHLKMNLVSIKGNSGYKNSEELLELMRLLPKGSPQREQAIIQVQLFYKQLTDLKGNLGEVKATAKGVVKLYFDTLIKMSNSALQSRFESFSAMDEQCKPNEITVVATSLVDSIMLNGVLKRINLEKNPHTTVKDLLIRFKGEIGGGYPEIIKLLERIEGMALTEILKRVLTEGMPDRAKIPSMLNELFQYLHDRLVSQKLKDFAAVVVEWSPAQKSFGELSSKAKEMINVMAKPLQLSRFDIDELVAGLSLFDNEKGTYSLPRLRELLAAVCSAKTNKKSFMAVSNLVKQLNLARYQFLTSQMIKHITGAQDRKEVRLIFRQSNEAQEMRRVKAKVAPLANLDEIGFIRTNMNEMQRDLVAHLDVATQEDVAYIKENYEAINEAYTDLMMLLSAKRDKDYTINLADYKLENFQLLIRGLDKHRLSLLTEQLRLVIQLGSDSSPFTKYLQVMVDVLEQHRSFENCSQAHAEFSQYAMNLQELLKQLQALSQRDYKQVDIDKVFSVLGTMQPLLTEFDKAMLKLMIADDQSPAHQDFYGCLRTLLLGREVGPVAEKRIKNRTRSFVQLMSSIPETANFRVLVSEKVVANLRAEKTPQEQAFVIQAMHETIKARLSAVVRKNQGDYFGKLRLAIEAFCESNVIEIMYENELEVICFNFISLQSRCFELDSSYDLAFMDDKTTEKLRFVLQHYTGQKNLQQQFQAAIDKMFDKFDINEGRIRDLIKFGKSTILNFGSQEQKERLCHLDDLIAYLDMADNKGSYHEAFQLQKRVSLAFGGKDFHADLFQQAHGSLCQKIRPQVIVEKVQAIIKVLGLQLPLVSQSNLHFTVPKILKSIFDFENKALRKISRLPEQEFKDIMGSIQSLFLFCQLDMRLLDSRDSKETAALKSQFIVQYIAMRNDHSNPQLQSMPCSTQFSEYLIFVLSLASGSEKQQALEARRGFKEVFQRRVRTIKVAADAVVKKMVGILKQPEQKLQSLKSQFCIELRTLYIPFSDVKGFIHFFNLAIKEHRQFSDGDGINIKWNEVEGQAKTSVLQEALADYFMKHTPPSRQTMQQPGASYSPSFKYAVGSASVDSESQVTFEQSDAQEIEFESPGGKH